LVATPIGNLEDITLRAIRILGEVDLIAAEDTRHTLKLLNHLKVKKPLISYYKQIEKTKAIFLVEKLLCGENIALVSDAGTPGISDPGEAIVKKAIENDIEVIPVPGACAVITSLMASGLSAEEFSFIGFLPVNKREKRKKLEEYKNLTQTLICYEAPHKLINTLESMQEVLGNREIVVARELTKIHEEFMRGKISEILDKYKEAKGEFVIIIEGSKQNEEEIAIESMKSKTLEEHLEVYLKKGMEKKDAIKQVAKDRNVQKNEIYQYFL